MGDVIFSADSNPLLTLLPITISAPIFRTSLTGKLRISPPSTSFLPPTSTAVNTEGIAICFVHHKRIDGNRIRIGACTAADDVVTIMTPYEVLTRRAFAFTTRNRCMQIVRQLYELAYVFDLQIGVLGSAALELITGLPYTDENSDIDLIVKPAGYNRLLQFYRAAQACCNEIKMDFELDLPNGYGVKLAEIFMETQTVLGKSLEDVSLLNRKDVMQYLKSESLCSCQAE